MLFSEVHRAQLAGRAVRMTLLAEVDLASAPMRLWSGHGPRVSGGKEWLGVGAWAGIGTLEQAVNGDAALTTIELDATDQANALRIMREFKTEAAGRKLVIYGQFFAAEDSTFLDAPYAFWAGRMARPVYQDEGTSRRLGIECESLFNLRGRPPYGQFSDADQKQRSPGDRGLEDANRGRLEIEWPGSF